ncbi:MAG: DNA cytosine methyltransferase [Dehalococcoidia bacterium]
MDIALFSFFSGVGLLDLAFQEEGFRIALANEFHRPFLDAYEFTRRRFSIEEPDYGYDESNVADFLGGKKRQRLTQHIRAARGRGSIVGFIGGPPCPDFSIGGKNKGAHGANGFLSQTYCDLIRVFKPDFFFFENVKGLWATHRHKLFYSELKRAIQFSGYLTTERLINSIEYGVPQDRQRVFFFGITRRLSEDLRLEIDADHDTIPEELFDWATHAKYSWREVVRLPWPERTKFGDSSELPAPTNVPLELTVEHWFRKNDVANHPNAGHYFKPRAALARFLSIDEGDTNRKSFKRLHRWRYSPTAAYGHNEVHLHPYKPRRLSVAEALAIQSLPPQFELPPYMTLTDMFQSLGNGVPFLASKMAARSIRSFLISRASNTDAAATEPAIAGQGDHHP